MLYINGMLNRPPLTRHMLLVGESILDLLTQLTLTVRRTWVLVTRLTCIPVTIGTEMVLRTFPTTVGLSTWEMLLVV